MTWFEKFLDWLFKALGFVPTSGGMETTPVDSEAIIRLLKELEGSSQGAYRDVGGLWTVGVGHLIKDNDVNLRKVGILTTDKAMVRLVDYQIDQLLLLDLEDMKASIASVIKNKVDKHQLDMILSLIFNIGPTQFRDSTMSKLLHGSGTAAEVGDQFLRWNKVNSKMIPGLTIRRVAEATIYRGLKSIPLEYSKMLAAKHLKRAQQLVDVYYGN